MNVQGKWKIQQKDWNRKGFGSSRGQVSPNVALREATTLPILFPLISWLPHSLTPLHIRLSPTSRESSLPPISMPAQQVVTLNSLFCPLLKISSPFGILGFLTVYLTDKKHPKKKKRNQQWRMVQFNITNHCNRVEQFNNRKPTTHQLEGLYIFLLKRTPETMKIKLKRR